MTRAGSSSSSTTTVSPAGTQPALRPARATHRMSQSRTQQQRSPQAPRGGAALGARFGACCGRGMTLRARCAILPPGTLQLWIGHTVKPRTNIIQRPRMPLVHAWSPAQCAQCMPACLQKP